MSNARRWLLGYFVSTWASSVAGCGGPVAGPDGALADVSVETDAAIVADAYSRAAPEVDIEGLGRVRGRYENGARSFYGIPYAEPPVGSLRWRSPVPARAWSGLRDAVDVPSACVQSALSFGAFGDEDCLYLNVHAPDVDPDPSRPVPVMVWIHGGAFVFGEGVQADRGTRGDLIAAARGVVVVSLNYRLGAFGFFVNDAVGANGNAGFEDQQLALRWVRDHIADFGGDPENITIFGESAGGLSVCLHLVAPGSRGLFHRAIIQSGLCDVTFSTRDERLAVGRGLVVALGCDRAADEAACLRGASTAAVRDASGLSSVFGTLTSRVRPWWPYVDGIVVPESFRDAVRGGRAANVPWIVGWTRDEGTLFVDLAERSGARSDAAAYHAVAASLAEGAGRTAAEVEARYPLASYPEPGAAIAAMLGHATLACPTRRAARLWAEHGHEVYVYRFDFPDAPFQLGERPGRDLGAFHSGEIQYVFGRSARLGRPRFDADEQRLSDAMQGAWASFAATGRPALPDGLEWPRYEASTDQHVVFDRVVAVGSGADRDACAFWEPRP